MKLSVDIWSHELLALGSQAYAAIVYSQIDNDNTFENDFAYPDQYLDLLDVTIDQHLSHQYSKTDNKKKYLAVAGTVGWPGRLLPQNTIFLMHQPITHSSGYAAVEVCTEE